MAHKQKSYFVFWRNGWVHLNRQERQFSRLLTAEVCASAVVMLDTPSSEVVWSGVNGTGYPLHSPVSPSLPLPCVTVCHHVSNAVYHGVISWGRGCIKRPVQRTNNLIAFMCWLSRNLWSLILIEPLVHTERSPFMYYFVLLLDCNNHIWRNIKAVRKLATAQWKLLWIKPWNWNHSTVTWFLDFVHCPIQRVQIWFGCRTPLQKKKKKMFAEPLVQFFPCAWC